MTISTVSFEQHLGESAKRTEALLASLLSGNCLPDEIARPAPLLAAMRHGTLDGGKRLRPFLVQESSALLGGDPQVAARVGCALECVHCYSLIHDDLPSMDNDDTRRGRPTVHRAFNEASAILAGDSLLTYAFDIIAAPETRLADRQKIQLVLSLSRASGMGGMAGGQSLDLAAENSAPDEAGIQTLQAMKTGALLRFACEAGAIIAGADMEDRQRLRTFGQKIGLAYQLADDLLDVKADAATLGKATGKDAARGKATLVALKGTDWAEERLSALTEEAIGLLAHFGSRANTLQQTARFIAERKS
ncbi:Putative Geranyltranstransferase (Farnesyl-diphosphate synthase) (FPP synthase) [Pseudorhizobium banfieldiae]|uniref:Probable farnesyl diphosphate synthase n=1 Tax=Pseudorhizobium banfieldiae TaxID=1125847 RepID=L0NKI3_9HYPH|nr:farnesyl diphosphate synthase [Pseudorhizobium banfieldiae]CAD6620035.1 polyprenyl synthetase family protein [arsenite-oxidising bacterium NT-25]CCF21331.1 Putative Geranyltranstransferase (Farnesyl-diphosphate synthase) (FPP synthase) [Pseudorhizobium banfieldiae]